MTTDQFYNNYIPTVLRGFLNSGHSESLEADLPEYIPYLQGCRYSLEQMTASFSGLTLETTRDKILLGLVRGNAIYHRDHLKEVAGLVNIGKIVMTTGGGAKIKGFLEAKKHWSGDFEFRYQDQSSLLGAAMLGSFTRRRDTNRFPSYFIEKGGECTSNPLQLWIFLVL